MCIVERLRCKVSHTPAAAPSVWTSRGQSFSWSENYVHVQKQYCSVGRLLFNCVIASPAHMVECIVYVCTYVYVLPLWKFHCTSIWWLSVVSLNVVHKKCPSFAHSNTLAWIIHMHYHYTFTYDQRPLVQSWVAAGFSQFTKKYSQTFPHVHNTRHE